MRAAFFALAVLPAFALATIQITSPNSNDYWVQNTSKTITWSYNPGDPTPISIFIVNSDVNVLNGAFSVDEYVNVASESYTITNVTLKVGSGYAVEFVNPTNYSDVYAISPRFEVEAAGTPPASSSSIGGSSSSGLGSPTSTSSTSKPSGTTSGGSTKNGAFSSSPNILFSLAACGFVAVASFFA
jgi:hypothetical protein